MSKYNQGIFTPINREKYKGKNIDKIFYRSSWELQFLKYLDRHKDILMYSFECLYIPYIYPFRKPGQNYQIRRYYPDFLIKLINKDKKIETLLIEIKPDHQTRKPVRKQGLKKQRLIYESAIYQINKAKWKAAEEFCKKHNIRWVIMTEKNLGNIINDN